MELRVSDESLFSNEFECNKCIVIISVLTLVPTLSLIVHTFESVNGTPYVYLPQKEVKEIHFECIP